MAENAEPGSFYHIPDAEAPSTDQDLQGSGHNTSQPPYDGHRDHELHPHVHPHHDEPQPKRKYVPSVCESIFATRQMAPKGDREVAGQYMRREVLVFVGYLVVICILTLGQPVNFDYSKMLFDLFLDEPIYKEEKQLASERSFRTSIHVLDFWLFVTHVLPHYLFWEDWYGASLTTVTNKSSANKHFVRKRWDNESTGILYQNVLLGVARLRQLRVETQPCPVVRNYRYLRKDECFPPYESKFEDTGNETGWWKREDEGGGVSMNLTSEAWRYRSEKELGGSSHWGPLASYSGAGAVCNLGKNATTTREIIAELRKSLWIVRSTRVVFLDFTIYNSNLNLFAIVRLVWEFSPTGGVVTSWNLRTVRLLRYVEFKDFYLVLPCEILFCLFTIYYYIQEILEVKHLGCKAYLRDAWSWVNLSILIITSICIAFSIYRYVLVNDQLIAITKNPNTFADFEFLGFWQLQFNHALALCAFFSWVKVFKYISFNKTMRQLSNTLSRCAKDIGGFAIMFFLCFFAFAQLGYLLFGSQLKDFSTFQDSILSLLRLILGDFNFRKMEAANRVLGPIYFLAFLFFVFFVLLNMFLAIINDMYSEVKAEVQAQRSEYEISDYLLGVWNNFRGLFGKRNTRIDAATAVKLAAEDGQLTYEELRQHLKNAHFSDVEVEMFLARYELDSLHDEGFTLDVKEVGQILSKLEEQIPEVSPNEDNGTETDAGKPNYLLEFSQLHDRIVIVEGSITDFVGKCRLLKTRIEEKKLKEIQEKLKI